jgi:hypothetical protein
MATTISTINESLVDQKVVAALRYILPMLKAFSYQVESEGKIVNDVVYVPIATDPTAQSKTAGTRVTANGTVAGNSVTLSNHYAAGWDATEGSIAPPVFANYWADKAAGAVYSLAKQVVDAALAVITAANFGSTEGEDKLTCSVADFGQNDLALLWQYAAVKIKQREISLGLNAPYAAALMGESSLAQVFAMSGTNFVQSGVLPMLIGMNTWAYPAFPANSENLGGAVFGRAAILVGVAPVAPLAAAGEGNIVERRIIRDPDSGIAVLYTMTADGAGTVNGECEVLYGVAKGQDAVVRLVSA